jgi:hypothetical protein
VDLLLSSLGIELRRGNFLFSSFQLTSTPLMIKANIHCFTGMQNQTILCKLIIVVFQDIVTIVPSYKETFSFRNSEIVGEWRAQESDSHMNKFVLVLQRHLLISLVLFFYSILVRHDVFLSHCCSHCAAFSCSFWIKKQGTEWSEKFPRDKKHESWNYVIYWHFSSKSGL